MALPRNSNDRTTHAEDISASIEMVLLKLKNLYFKTALPSSKTIDDAYSVCLFQIKEGIDNLQINKNDKQSILAAFENIKELTNDQNNILHSFNKVRFFNNGKELENTFTLREILILAWQAVDDDISYAHHGSVDKAIKDRPLRLNNFFNALKNIQKGSRIGNYKEFIWLLNNEQHSAVNLIPVYNVEILSNLKITQLEKQLICNDFFIKNKKLPQKNELLIIGFFIQHQWDTIESIVNKILEDKNNKNIPPILNSLILDVNNKNVKDIIKNTILTYFSDMSDTSFRKFFQHATFVSFIKNLSNDGRLTIPLLLNKLGEEKIKEFFIPAKSEDNLLFDLFFKLLGDFNFYIRSNNDSGYYYYRDEKLMIEIINVLADTNLQSLVYNGKSPINIFTLALKKENFDPLIDKEIHNVILLLLARVYRYQCEQIPDQQKAIRIAAVTRLINAIQDKQFLPNDIDLPTAELREIAQRYREVYKPPVANSQSSSSKSVQKSAIKNPPPPPFTDASTIDANEIIYSFTGPTLYKLYFEHYKTLKYPFQKKEIFAALFKWMTDSNAIDLFKQVDQKNTIRACLNDLLTEKGINPEAINVQRDHLEPPIIKTLDTLLKDETLPSLPFAGDRKKTPGLIAANAVLNISANNKKTSLEATALEIMKETAIDLTNENHLLSIMDFNLVYPFHESYKKYKMLLRLDKQYKEENITSLDRIFQDYFKSPFNPLEQKTRDQIPTLNNLILKAKKENHVTEIEDFFAGWFSKPISYENRSNLYSKLIDKAFQEKITLKDSDLPLFINKDEITDNRPIGRYEINRVVLHALITPFDTWTSTFSEYFNFVYSQFVEMVFKKGKIKIDSTLSPDSYPSEFIVQLENLEDYRIGKKNIEPEKIISLPNDIITFEKFQEIGIPHFSLDLRKNILEKNDLLRSIVENGYIDFLKTVLLPNPENEETLSTLLVVFSITPEIFSRFVSRILMESKIFDRISFDNFNTVLRGVFENLDPSYNELLATILTSHKPPLALQFDAVHVVQCIHSLSLYLKEPKKSEFILKHIDLLKISNPNPYILNDLYKAISSGRTAEELDQFLTNPKVKKLADNLYHSFLQEKNQKTFVFERS